jgi:putative hydrolase of HD superfamily
MADAQGLRECLRRAGALRDTPRNTLKPSGVPESTAEHSWRLALLALLTAPPELDRGRVLALCLLHDLAEAVTGDIPAVARPDPGVKAEAESRALSHLLETAPAETRALVTGLLDDYAAQASPEARFVKAADRCETVLAHAEAPQPAGFDWRFNLDYGKGLADPFPLLAALRRIADAETAAMTGGDTIQGE